MDGLLSRQEKLCPRRSNGWPRSGSALGPSRHPSCPNAFCALLFTSLVPCLHHTQGSYFFSLFPLLPLPSSTRRMTTSGPGKVSSWLECTFIFARFYNNNSSTDVPGIVFWIWFTMKGRQKSGLQKLPKGEKVSIKFIHIFTALSTTLRKYHPCSDS